jgi:hypothetical protein
MKPALILAIDCLYEAALIGACVALIVLKVQGLLARMRRFAERDTPSEPDAR